MVFHQLFEGFSLGVRIAAIPAKGENQEDGTEEVGSDDVMRGTSRGDLEALPNKKHSKKGARWYSPVTDMHWLNPTLSFLFGVTTPAGMALGMTLWPSTSPGHGGGV